jgi:hypothetical protein
MWLKEAALIIPTFSIPTWSGWKMISTMKAWEVLSFFVCFFIHLNELKNIGQSLITMWDAVCTTVQFNSLINQNLNEKLWKCQMKHARSHILMQIDLSEAIIKIIFFKFCTITSSSIFINCSGCDFCNFDHQPTAANSAGMSY